MADVKDRLLDAAVGHVPFDGWGPATFAAAIIDADIEPGLAHGICPRGAVDLAIAYHKRGDMRMVERIVQADMSEMKFRDKITAAVRYRLEVVEDKEIVRRGMTLLALPQYAGDGTRAIWQTCGLIWDTLGDTSDDINWYTKRATLSGVYSATVLFWLGDDSEGHADTWEFLDRRIGDVMQIEIIKAGIRGNKVLGPLLRGPLAALGRVRAPQKNHKHNGMPGSITPK